MSIGSIAEPTAAISAQAKIRHKHDPAPHTKLSPTIAPDHLRNPPRALTPGQGAVSTTRHRPSRRLAQEIWVCAPSWRASHAARCRATKPTSSKPSFNSSSPNRRPANAGPAPGLRYNFRRRRRVQILRRSKSKSRRNNVPRSFLTAMSRHNSKNQIPGTVRNSPENPGAKIPQCPENITPFSPAQFTTSLPSNPHKRFPHTA